MSLHPLIGDWVRRAQSPLPDPHALHKHNLVDCGSWIAEQMEQQIVVLKRQQKILEREAATLEREIAELQRQLADALDSAALEEAR